MNKFLIMISMFMFFLTSGNAWSQIRPVPPPKLPPLKMPMPDTRTLEGEPIPTMVLVPEVRGYHQEKAERFLMEAGLSLGKVEKVQSDQPKGTVIGQKPEPGSRVDPHSPVNLKVAIPATR